MTSFTRRARRWLRLLGDAFDRALHAIRRAEARRRLRGIVPQTVLFVCQGNVCRSPFAAGVFAREWSRRVGVPVTVLSAGFVGADRTPPANALLVAAQRDVDLSPHRSVIVRPPMIAAATLVVTMSIEQARAARRVGGLAVKPLVLGDLDPQPILTRTVVDPWGKADSVFEESYARIERCVAELVRIMAPRSDR